MFGIRRIGSSKAWSANAVIAVLLPTLILAQTNVQQPVPGFENYRVPTPIPGRPDGPVYVANRVPDLQGVLRQTAKVGPNFAGRYVVEQWTCGSACIDFVLVEVKTGVIHSSNFRVIDVCPEFGGRSPLVYRLNSRLLLVKGRLETYPAGQMVDGPCGHFYYEWTSNGLKLIHSAVPATALSK